MREKREEREREGHDSHQSDEVVSRRLQLYSGSRYFDLLLLAGGQMIVILTDCPAHLVLCTVQCCNRPSILPSLSPDHHATASPHSQISLSNRSPFSSPYCLPWLPHDLALQRSKMHDPKHQVRKITRLEACTRPPRRPASPSVATTRAS